MTYLEQQLDSVSRFITIAGEHCLFCPERCNLHNHHLFYGRWKSVWYFRWMPVFQIPLCGEHHLYSPFSPHVNLHAFWAKLEDTLSRTNPQRLKLINYYRNSKVNIPEKSDLKVLLKDLREQAEKIDSEQWMNVCDETYRGRDPKGEPIWT